jgi:hypothetical protein
MADKLTWTTEKRRLGDLREWERNPRQLSKVGGYDRRYTRAN